jgi:riboflavin synthase alpha subunit
MVRKFLLGHIIEGKIEGRVEVKERRRKTRKQLLYNLKENK